MVDLILVTVILATLLLAAATAGTFFIISAMGIIPNRGDAGELRRYHRYLGRIAVLLIVVVAGLCVYYLAPGAPPDTRVNFHKGLGALTLLFAFGKIGAARTNRRYLPLLGRPLYLLVLLSWASSAAWYFSSLL
jgi:hypothetical protein